MDELVRDTRRLRKALAQAGVPAKLIESIARKSLRTPRRQTGRADRRTNRHPRWSLSQDHPDYATELDARLVHLKLLLELLGMKNAPAVDPKLANELAHKYFSTTIEKDNVTDPMTDELIDYHELEQDIVHKPKHGYSKFHIGHQDPTVHPKHTPSNVRWQFKSSNDFQGKMEARVARIAFHIDQLYRYTKLDLIAQIQGELGDVIDMTKKKGRSADEQSKDVL